MAKKNNSSGVTHSNPYNETDNRDPNTPEMSGDDIYYGGCPEVQKMHLSNAGVTWGQSNNSMSGKGTLGGPASGEPQVVDLKE